MRVTANMSADTSVYNIQQGRNRLDRLQEATGNRIVTGTIDVLI